MNKEKMDRWEQLEQTYDGLFTAGSGDVKSITTTPDKRSQFVWFENQECSCSTPT